MPALECGLETYVAIAVAGKKREATASSHVCRVACVSRTLIVCLDFLQARAHGHRHRGKPFWGSGTDACGRRKLMNMTTIVQKACGNCASLCYSINPGFQAEVWRGQKLLFFLFLLLLLQFTVAVSLHCPCYIIAGTAFMSSLHAPALKSRVSNQYPFTPQLLSWESKHVGNDSGKLKIRHAPVRLIANGQNTINSTKSRVPDDACVLTARTRAMLLGPTKSIWSSHF